MKDQTTTATTAPAAKPAKKQWNVGINPRDKQTVTDLALEFKRPAAVKGAPDVNASEREIVEIALAVATDRRFKTVPIMETVDVDGETLEIEALDEDGNVRFETVDLFAKEWEKIKTRDYSEAVSKTPTIEGLIAQIRKYGATLKLSEDAINAMIATATAPATAPEETPETAPVE